MNKAKGHGDLIIELVCGTMRITIQIATEGLSITGLDLLNIIIIASDSVQSKNTAAANTDAHSCSFLTVAYSVIFLVSTILPPILNKSRFSS